MKSADILKKINVLFLFYFLFSSLTCHAQDIQMGAWLENDQIIVRCEESPNVPLKNAEIIIWSNPGKAKLLTGRSDAAGYFVFNVPTVVREGQGLVIEVIDANGFRKEWGMTASELYAASSLTAGFDRAELESSGDTNMNSDVQPSLSPLPMPSYSSKPSPSKEPAVSLDNIKSMVNELLESQLAPIRAELAARKTEFSWSETMGGVGWLIGILGIIFFFMARRKNG